MAELHLLKRLILSRYRQFAYVGIDLIDPTTGTIVPDLCLLGSNGSGKSSLLAELYQSMDPAGRSIRPPGDELADALVLAKYSTDGNDIYLARHAGGVDGEVLVVSTSIELSDRWNSLATSPPGFEEFRSRFADHLLDETAPAPARAKRRAWFSPGLSLLNGTTAEDFAAFLERHLKERELQFHHFLKQPENRDKTVAELERDFENEAPSFLTALKEIWDLLMEPCGLQFDFFQPDPVLLRGGDRLPFTALSPSLQTVLLRLGQVASQHFGSTSPSGSLFLDTPEEGLCPELRATLIDFYRRFLLTPKAPLFVATHCPLIAAQFSPERCLHLVSREDGSVTLARREVTAAPESPESAAPEYKLEVGVEPEVELIETPAPPRKRVVPHGRYTQLKKAIQQNDNQDELADLIDEMMKMRNL